MKPSGEFTLGDIGGLALSAAMGIGAAIVTDYQQRGEGSALFTINRWVVEFGRFFALGDVPLWSVMAGLVGVGALSVFYMQPTTRQGAFAQGYGLLAALMMAAPPDLGGGLPAMTAREIVAEQSRPRVVNAAFAAVEAPAAAMHDVRIEAHFPNGLRNDLDAMVRRGAIRGRIHNAATGETFNLFRSAGGVAQMQGDVLVVSAGVPAKGAADTLWIRIEAAGYAIEEQSAEARLGALLDWRIDMRPSATPLFLQRLGRSYWF